MPRGGVGLGARQRGLSGWEQWGRREGRGTGVALSRQEEGPEKASGCTGVRWLQSPGAGAGLEEGSGAARRAAWLEQTRAEHEGRGWTLDLILSVTESLRGFWSSDLGFFWVFFHN